MLKYIKHIVIATILALFCHLLLVLTKIIIKPYFLELSELFSKHLLNGFRLMAEAEQQQREKHFNVRQKSYNIEDKNGITGIIRTRATRAAVLKQSLINRPEVILPRFGNFETSLSMTSRSRLWTSGCHFGRIEIAERVSIFSSAFFVIFFFIFITALCNLHQEKRIIMHTSEILKWHDHLFHFISFILIKQLAISLSQNFIFQNKYIISPNISAAKKNFVILEYIKAEGPRGENDDNLLFVKLEIMMPPVSLRSVLSFDNPGSRQN